MAVNEDKSLNKTVSDPQGSQASCRTTDNTGVHPVASVPRRSDGEEAQACHEYQTKTLSVSTLECELMDTKLLSQAELRIAVQHRYSSNSIAILWSRWMSKQGALLRTRRYWQDRP